jgi:hypothetical protein
MTFKEKNRPNIKIEHYISKSGKLIKLLSVDLVELMQTA